MTPEQQETDLAKMTPEQIADLAAEIIADVRDEAFDGDRWLGREKACAVVAAVLDRWPVCEDCAHPMKLHHSPYGCEYERGDGYRGNAEFEQALGPCSCRAAA